MFYMPLETCERRAAPSVLLEAMPAVQINFFQDFMIWCLDYICLAVEVWGLNNLSKERIAPAPDMCAFGVQLQPWHCGNPWGGMKSSDTLQCREEGHIRWQRPGRGGYEPPSPPGSPCVKVSMALAPPCRWGAEAGKLGTFPRPQSRAVLSLCPWRWWQWTEAEEWQWQPGRVYRNPLSEPWWRITCQGSYPMTPTLHTLLFHSPGPLIPICFSHLSSPTTFFSSPFLHPPIPLSPPHHPSQHRSLCPPTTLLILPQPSITSHLPQPLASANILCLPTEANRIHSYTHTFQGLRKPGCGLQLPKI